MSLPNCPSGNIIKNQGQKSQGGKEGKKRTKRKNSRTRERGREGNENSRVEV